MWVEALPRRPLPHRASWAQQLLGCGWDGWLTDNGWRLVQVSYEAALSCYYDDTEQLTAKPGTLKSDAHGDRMTSMCFWMHGVSSYQGHVHA
jgi:hypothetical protein